MENNEVKNNGQNEQVQENQVTVRTAPIDVQKRDKRNSILKTIGVFLAGAATTGLVVLGINKLGGSDGADE